MSLQNDVTPAMIAATAGHCNALEALIHHRADIDRADNVFSVKNEKSNKFCMVLVFCVQYCNKKN